MGLQCLVNGVSRPMLQDRWTITQSWGRHGDTAKIYIRDEHPDLILNFHIPPLASVVVSDTTTGAQLFAGITNDPVLQYYSPNLHEWQLSCVDYSTYMDNIVVAGSWSYTQADQIVTQLLGQANCGITAAAIEPGPTIPRCFINYMTLTDALKHVTALASQTAEYGYYVDGSLGLHWYNTLQAQSSGVTLTDVASGPATTSLGYYYGGADGSTAWNYEWNATKLVTSAIVKGGSYSAIQTDSFVSNGYTSSFPLTYEIDTTVNQAQVLVGGGVNYRSVSITNQQGVTSGGGVQTQLLQPTATTVGEWQIVQSATGQWFLQPGTDPLPAAGTVIEVAYRYKGPVIARADAASLQQAYGGPNRGVWQEIISDSSLITTAAAFARAQSDVQLYGPVQELVALTTTENFPGHIAAGQTFRWVNQTVPDMQRDYASGIDALFIVLQQTIQGVAGNYRQYQLQAQRVSVT